MAALLLTGCSDTQVSAARQQAVEVMLRKQLEPVTPKMVSIWYSGGNPSSIICGEIEAPRRLRSEQSSLRFEAMADALVLEPHLIAAGPVGQQIAAESASIFENTWNGGCAPHAPLTRRLAGWLHASGASGQTDTPLTNAYIEEIIAGSRRRGPTDNPHD